MSKYSQQEAVTYRIVHAQRKTFVFGYVVGLSSDFVGHTWQCDVSIRVLDEAFAQRARISEVISNENNVKGNAMDSLHSLVKGRLMTPVWLRYLGLTFRDCALSLLSRCDPAAK